MATIDTRPNVVDVACYAGDTLSLTIIVDSAFVAGREWTAQVRSNRGSATVDATFIVNETAEGAVISLPSTVTRSLAEGGSRIRTPRAAIVRYSGEWDVQIAEPGGLDPVTTLAQGSITIDLDVTRAP